MGTYYRLGVTVAASRRTVIREARGKIAEHHRRGPDKREARKAFYREQLACHEAAQRLAAEYRL